MRKFAILSIASLMTVSVAYAENDRYVGISQNFIDIDAPDLGAEFTTFGSSLIYGAKISDNSGVEASYNIAFDIEVTPTIFEGQSDVDFEVTTIDLSALYYFDSWTDGFFVQAGISKGDAKLSGAGYSGTEDDAPLFFGFGFDIPIGDTGLFRLAYRNVEYEDLGTIDVSQFGASALLKF